MCEDFLNMLDENLINKNFLLLKNNHSILKDTKIYLKIIDNIGYVIMPVIASSDYNKIFEDTALILEIIRNKQKLNSIIFIKMIVNDKLSSQELIFLNQELVFDTKVIGMIWGIETSTNKIIIKSSQPKKFMGIENIVKSSLENKVYVDLKEDKKLKKLAILSTNTSITYLIIYILVLIFAVVYNRQEEFIASFAITPNIVYDKEYYRLFSAMFLHINITHLLSNCLSLYIFGTRVEKFMGKQFFLIVYILGGIIGSIFSVLFTQAVSVGASGAIYALEGATFYFVTKNRVALDGINFHIMLILSVLGLAIGFTENNIDVAGHIGGFLAGFIMCMFYNIGYKKKYIKKYKI